MGNDDTEGFFYLGSLTSLLHVRLQKGRVLPNDLPKAARVPVVAPLLKSLSDSYLGGIRGRGRIQSVSFRHANSERACVKMILSGDLTRHERFGRVAVLDD
jgi:hypothetical protein